MDAKRQSKTLSVIPTNANEKGIVLVGTIALVALLALFGTLGIITTTTEIIISKNHKTSVQARYVTEAGIHRTIGMLNSSPGWIAGLADPTSDAFPGDNSFGNGTYVVKVFEDDPTPGKIRINTTGDVNGSSSTFEAIVTPDEYSILDYATFDCGNFDLKVGENNIITGDVFVDGDLILADSGIQLIIGDVYATGTIDIGGTSSITGNAYANGNIDLSSTASPNIDGNATAGGSVNGTAVSGTISQGVTPAPVADLCNGNNMAGITITSEDIQNFRDNADYTFVNYEYTTADNFTGIIYVSGDFELLTDSTYSGNVVIVVDGSVDITGSLTKHASAPAGSSVVFIVPNGDFKVKGFGNVVIDGTVLVGTVDADGSNPIGGNIDVTENANLTVNGNVIAVNTAVGKGNTDAGTGGIFTVNYQSLDGNDLINPGTYAMTQWREIRN